VYPTTPEKLCMLPSRWKQLLLIVLFDIAGTGMFIFTARVGIIFVFAVMMIMMIDYGGGVMVPY